MNRGKAAFTRLDLLVVVSVVGVFALLGAPVAGRAKSEADVAACLDHNRELISAWINFAMDNGDAFATTVSMPDTPSWLVRAWGNGTMTWDTAPDVTNRLYLTEPRFSVLAEYLQRRSAPYKCPADVFISQAQKQFGWMERVRSVAGNGMMGIGNDFSPSGPSFDPYIRVRRFGDLLRPAPANTFVFLEEHPDSLGDCAFFGPAGETNSLTWWDFPANYHEGGAMFSFADGRAELHRWQGLVRTAPTQYLRAMGYEPKQVDQRWVSERLSRKALP